MKKLLLLLLAAVLSLPVPVSGAYISDIMRIGPTQYQTAFGGLNGEKRSVEFYYEDDFFYKTATQRNDDLAKVSAVLSALAYDEYNLSATLEKMGFDNIYSMDYQNISDIHTAPVTLACKKIMNGLYDLIVIVIRGTGDVGEWISNLDVGFGDRHAGFAQALHSDISHFKVYYEAMRQAGIIDDNADNNRIWITGHSRGAAVANMLAASLDGGDSGYVTGENHLFAYTFAAPNVTNETIPAGDYLNIFNYVNPGDIVCSVPLNAWGYSRYGETVTWDADGPIGWRTGDLFREMTGYRYRGTTEKANLRLVESIQQAYEENKLNWGLRKFNTTAIAHAHSTELYVCWMDAILAAGPSEAAAGSAVLSLAEVQTYLGKTRAQIAQITSNAFVRDAEPDPYQAQPVTLSFDDWNGGILDCVTISVTGTAFDTITVGMTVEQIETAWNMLFDDDGGIEGTIWRGEKDGLEILLNTGGWDKTDSIEGLWIFRNSGESAALETPVPSTALSPAPVIPTPTAAPKESVVSGDSKKLIGIWTATILGISTTMEFTDDGRMITTALGFSVEYDYTVSGGTITVTMKSPYAQGGVQQIGISTFSISGDQLLLDGVVYQRFK